VQKFRVRKTWRSWWSRVFDGRRGSGCNVSEFKFLKNLESRELTRMTKLGRLKAWGDPKNIFRFKDSTDTRESSRSRALRLLKYTNASPTRRNFRVSRTRGLWKCKIPRIQGKPSLRGSIPGYFFLPRRPIFTCKLRSMDDDNSERKHLSRKGRNRAFKAETRRLTLGGREGGWEIRHPSVAKTTLPPPSSSSSRYTVQCTTSRQSAAHYNVEPAI